MAERNMTRSYIAPMPQYSAESTARKLRRSVRELPEDPWKEPVRHTRAKVRVAPFMVAGIAAIVMLAVMVILSASQLNAAQNAGSQLQKQLEAAQQESQSIQAQYNALATPEAVENYAVAHGMEQADAGRTVYVQVPHADEAQLGKGN